VSHSFISQFDFEHSLWIGIYPFNIIHSWLRGWESKTKSDVREKINYAVLLFLFAIACPKKKHFNTIPDFFAREVQKSVSHS